MKMKNYGVISISFILIVLGSQLILTSANAIVDFPDPPNPPGPTTVIYNGYIKDTDSAPIENTCVKLYMNGVVQDTEYTNSRGSYYLSAVDPSGTIKIKVFKSGYLNQSKTVSTNGGSYNFELKGLWALIVDGQEHESQSDNEVRFTRDAYGMYQTLTNYYGFSSERTYYLSAATSLASYANEPAITNIPRDYKTTRDNVELAIGEIATGACSGDQVFIWWTGHGVVDYLVSDNTASPVFVIKADDFNDYLNAITCKEMYIFLGQCHSGSFEDDLNGQANRAIYMSCTSNQLGKTYTPPLPADPNTPTHSLFPWATYQGLNPNLNAADADVNHADNWVSLSELLDYCFTFVQNHLPASAQQNPYSCVGSAITESDAFIGTKYY